MANERYVVVFGGLCDGINRIVGPFEDFDLACECATRECSTSEWYVVPIEAPDDEDPCSTVPINTVDATAADAAFGEEDGRHNWWGTAED